MTGCRRRSWTSSGGPGGSSSWVARPRARPRPWCAGCCTAATPRAPGRWSSCRPDGPPTGSATPSRTWSRAPGATGWRGRRTPWRGRCCGSTPCAPAARPPRLVTGQRARRGHRRPARRPRRGRHRPGLATPPGRPAAGDQGLPRRAPGAVGPCGRARGRPRRPGRARATPLPPGVGGRRAGAHRGRAGRGPAGRRGPRPGVDRRGGRRPARRPADRAGRVAGRAGGAPGRRRRPGPHPGRVGVRPRGGGRGR